MTKKNVPILSLKIFLFISLAIIISIKYLDAEIAVRVMSLLRFLHILRKNDKSIPDLLLHFVGFGTIVTWVIYLYRLHKKNNDIKTQFLKFVGIILPISYLVKSILKFVFGRTSPREWLFNRKPLTFNWFNGWSGSFPSGHMVVFAAFGVAVLIYFPQFRKMTLILLSLLGIALVVTDYHFLSDVMAGAYIGAITTYLIRYIMEKQQIKH